MEGRMRLAGKTAIVTGAGSGFGAGIARKFAAEGARVLVADLNETAARAVAEEIGGVACGVDVANGHSVLAMARAADALGPVDILVNNAGSPTCPHRWKRWMRRISTEIGRAHV